MEKGIKAIATVLCDGNLDRLADSLIDAAVVQKFVDEESARDFFETTKIAFSTIEVENPLVLIREGYFYRLIKRSNLEILIAE